MYQPRLYREFTKRKNTIFFPVMYKDTDLLIGVDKVSFSSEMPEKVYSWIKDLRTELEEYIDKNKEFLNSLSPVSETKDAPYIAKKMCTATKFAGIGPMAAVAGAFSEEIGKKLKKKFKVKEILIENGGDLYLDIATEATVGIYAGNSPLSNKIALKINPQKTPLGVCTSSGTVGHSLSFGKADAVVAVSKSAYYADAYATAICNKVQDEKSIASILEWAKTLPHLKGVVIILNDKLGAWGDIEIISL